MAISRVKTWGSEILTASDLNAEFNNILDNALSLISPLTGNLDVDGFDLVDAGELEFRDESADPTADGRFRRSGDELTWRTQDARTNTTARNFALWADTTGTPAASIGIGMLFQAESADENPSDFGALDFVATDVTGASEDTELRIFTRAAGAALAEIARLSSTAASFGTTSTTAQMNVTSGAAGRIGLIVDTAAAPTAVAQEWRNNGTSRANLDIVDGGTTFTFFSFDNGSGLGTFCQMERNSNATTPAPGFLRLEAADAALARVWSDNAMDLRIWEGGNPTNANLTAGTVVGTQTSWWALKQNIIPFMDYTKALAAVVNTPLYSFDLNERHYDAGYVIHDEDKGKWFSWNDQRQQVPALNERQILGYHAASIKALHERLEDLEGRIQ